MNDAEKREIRRLYEDEGISTERLAPMYGVSSTTICRYIRDTGGTIRSHGAYGAATIQQILDLYGDEDKLLSFNRIGQILGIKGETARNIYVRAGGKPRPKHLCHSGIQKRHRCELCGIPIPKHLTRCIFCLWMYDDAPAKAIIANPAAHIRHKEPLPLAANEIDNIEKKLWQGATVQEAIA